MKDLKTLISTIGSVAVFAGTLAVQPMVVTGTGDPNLDVPTVQAAVDRGSSLMLTGHFSFDRPPTTPAGPRSWHCGADAAAAGPFRCGWIRGALPDRRRQAELPAPSPAGNGVMGCRTAETVATRGPRRRIRTSPWKSVSEPDRFTVYDVRARGKLGIADFAGRKAQIDRYFNEYLRAVAAVDAASVAPQPETPAC